MKVKLNGKDITKLTESLSITNSIESLSTTITINIPYYKETPFLIDVKVGDKLSVENVFDGIVVDVVYNKHSTEFKSFDVSFYLGKNSIMKQLRNVGAKEGINAICSEIGIPIDVKGSLSTKVNLMFKNKVVSECIKEILNEDFKKTGKEYFIYSKSNKVIIEELGKEEIKTSYKINDSDILDKEKMFFEKVITENIEDLKNAIVVTTDDEKSLKILSKEEDSGSINKYGKLQEVITLNSKENKEAKSVAKTTLNTLNKIKKTINVNLISDNYIQSGKYILFEGNKYLIKSVNLNFNKGKFEGSLELREMI